MKSRTFTQNKSRHQTMWEMKGCSRRHRGKLSCGKRKRMSGGGCNCGLGLVGGGVNVLPGRVWDPEHGGTHYPLLRNPNIPGTNLSERNTFGGSRRNNVKRNKRTRVTRSKRGGAFGSVINKVESGYNKLWGFPAPINSAVYKDQFNY